MTQSISPAQTTSTDAVCPNCNASVKKGSKFCPECGNPMPQKKFCTECGTQLGANAKFCPECGTKVGA